MEVVPGFQQSSGQREYGALPLCLIVQIPLLTDWLLNVGQQVREPVKPRLKQ